VFVDTRRLWALHREIVGKPNVLIQGERKVGAAVPRGPDYRFMLEYLVGVYHVVGRLESLVAPCGLLMLQAFV
jgi:hypothetical protein